MPERHAVAWLEFGLRSAGCHPPQPAPASASVLAPLQGHRKPAPESFAAAVRHLGLPGDELLLIDDRQPNVDGARSVGLCAIRFQSAPQLEAELRAAGLEF